MSGVLLGQFPRFSAYDPGAAGEGSLDPLGFSALADRIADRLAPGVRARMNQPRFVTLSAIGAFACQPISDIVSSDGMSTYDLAFEWLVVESLVKYPKPERLKGVPGSHKALAAAGTKPIKRLCAANYLKGPRVFGFTGVYRPFSQDSGVLDRNGMPTEVAERLIVAWEQDQGLDGFMGGDSRSKGWQFRREIEKTCLASLKSGQATAPPAGWLMRWVADSMAPREAKSRERKILRQLVTSGQHEVRKEITDLLAGLPATQHMSQLDIATKLADKASPATRTALMAAINFEKCATAIENAFRRLLAYAMSRGGLFSDRHGKDVPKLGDVAEKLDVLTRRAVDASAALDESLALDASACFAHFDRAMTPSEFINALISRHQQVQESMKGKRMWIEPIRNEWWVRTPYRNQNIDLDDREWSHPMRLHALSSFLRETE